MDKKFYILDLDDGPDGGGGAALARLLASEKIKHSCWVPSTLNSGWDIGNHVLCCASHELADVLRDESDDTTFVPGSWAALDVLTGLQEEVAAGLPSQLTDLLSTPRGLDSLTAAAANGLGTVGHFILTNKVARATCQAMIKGGWILHDDGTLQEVGDDGDAWYAINKRMRHKSGACALIPSLGRFLFLGAHLVEDGRASHSTFLRADSIRPSWRPALARTVNGRIWNRVVEALDDFEFPDGFHQTVWLYGPGGKKAEFLASTPLPSVAIGVEGKGWAEAIKGQGDPSVTSQGLYYADAPIDLAVDYKTLLKRSLR